ncbi:hypothetical protein LguiB_035203 [Lonicera macranthoides]
MVVDISRKNGSFRSSNVRQPDMVLVDKDTWLSSEDGDSKPKGHTFKLPKMIIITTKITMPVPRLKRQKQKVLQIGL